MNDFIKQMQISSQSMKRQLTESANQYSLLMDKIKPITDLPPAAQEVLKLNIFTKAKIDAEILKAYPMSPPLNVINSVMENIHSFQTEMKIYFDKMSKSISDSIKELPPKIETIVLKMGERGWYFDLEMPFQSLGKIYDAFKAKDVDIDKAMIMYFHKRSKPIRDEIIKRFKNRENIIQAAFQAHDRAEYELSVPIFLIQVDGLCYDITKHNLFQKGNRKLLICDYIEKLITGSFQSALLSPLKKPLPIYMNKHERHENFNELNRHQVLHGESIDYGTEINSLKAISLLNYIAFTLIPIK